MQAAGKADTSPTTCTRPATLFVRPSDPLRSRPNVHACLVGAPSRHIPYPGVDTRSGSVFCADCDDLIYDATIDDAYLTTVLLIEEQLTRFQGTTASL